jgi:hypothetical protein
MPRAIFTFSEDTYCVALWWIPGFNQDWLAMLSRENGQWKFIYRFRYYRDEKHFNSADEKSVYGWEADANEVSEDVMLEKADQCAKLIEASGYVPPGETPWRRVIRGNGGAALEALKAAPFTKMKQSEVH